MKHSLLLLPEGVNAPAGYLKLGAYVEERINPGTTPAGKKFKMTIVIWQKQ